MGETRETGDTGESRAVDGRDKGDRGHGGSRAVLLMNTVYALWGKKM